jgi:hypothetical protein
MAKRQATKKAASRAPARATKKVARKRPASRAAAKAGPARRIVVMVGDPDPNAIHKVATALRSRGMQVDSILEATGMITGTYRKAPASLSRVKGVSGVEETGPIQLAPPGSDIQ